MSCMSCGAYKRHNSNNKFQGWSKALISTMVSKCNDLSESAQRMCLSLSYANYACLYCFQTPLIFFRPIPTAFLNLAEAIFTFISMSSQKQMKLNTD